MKIPDSNEAFNIAVIGMWNPAIFSPQWVKEHLSSDPMQEVTLAFALGSNNSVRVTVDGINIFPAQNMCVLNCIEPNDDGISLCAEKILSICELLPHTPVTALGFNFRYVGKLDDSQSLMQLFNFNDIANIDSEKFKAAGSSVKRTFRLSENDLLNISFDLNEDVVRVEFNYHSDVTSIQSLKEKVTPQRALDLKKETLKFFADVYDIEVDFE